MNPALSMNRLDYRRKSGVKKILTLILAASLIFICKPADCASLEKGQGRIMRVAIIDDKEKISLSLKGRYKIYAIDTDRVIMEGPYLDARLLPTKEGIKVGDKDIKLYGIKIKVLHDANIYIDGRRFRGEVGIIRKEDGRIMVINRIDLEEYLYGVLYHEVSHRWPMEALKAQAIAARTFALNQAAQNKLQPYDLRCDIYSQVYGGRSSEKWSTTRAVDLTRDKVLTYNGKIFSAYYHATCAGRTEDAVNLWNVDLAPLKGVQCDFCKESPHYKWRKEIPLERLEEKLRTSGYKTGKVISVNILSKNRSGRAEKIEIKDDAGVSVILTAKDFRQMMGPNEVRSTRFDASIRWGRIILDGFGWGHGVGMCQWGAFGMSRRGKTAEEILKYYYPGAEITIIDKL